MTGPTLRRDRRGVISMEMGLIALPLTLFLFGVVELGMVIRMKSALQFATTNAARCSAVNVATCGTTDATKAYAQTQTQGGKAQHGKAQRDMQHGPASAWGSAVHPVGKALLHACVDQKLHPDQGDDGPMQRDLGRRITGPLRHYAGNAQTST